MTNVVSLDARRHAAPPKDPSDEACNTLKEMVFLAAMDAMAQFVVEARRNGESKDNIDTACSELLYSIALPDDSPEIAAWVEARKQKLRASAG